MIRFDRRQLLATGAFGIGGLLLPAGRATAQALSSARGFTHNVASGEPAADSVLLWTRFVGTGTSAHVRAEIAEDEAFARIIAKNSMITGPWRDWTAKITLDGLAPAHRYFYRFVGEDGSMSPVGRTKTLPVGNASRFALAIVSCSNLPFGMFNAYAHAAARDDIDATLHLGDYFYEYKRGGYPADNPRWDMVAPQTETITIADYRLRYASYRADPDLQSIHNRHPMIASMDDHESANDSWEGGAQNHDESEGDWNVRKAAALQVWREWMPIDDFPYKEYQIGSLATLFRTETRLLHRSAEVEPMPFLTKGDPAAALAAFKHSKWIDPAMTMMGTTQESWLVHRLKASVAAKTRWQVVGSGTIMSFGYTPSQALNWLAPDAPERSRQWVERGIELAKAGLPFNMDSWSGYPAARERLLRAGHDAGANMIVLSGDSHNAWAFALGNVPDKPTAVEFAGHSVTSPGYESSTQGTDPNVIAAAMIKSSPELKWCDTSNRGYMALTLTPQAATNEWVFMHTIGERSLATKPSHRMRVRPGRAKLETV